MNLFICEEGEQHSLRNISTIRLRIGNTLIWKVPPISRGPFKSHSGFISSLNCQVSSSFGLTCTVLNLLFHWSPLICTSIVFRGRGIVMSQCLLFSQPITNNFSNRCRSPTVLSLVFLFAHVFCKAK